MASSFEYGDEPSCFIKFGEFLDSLSRFQLLRQDSVPCNDKEEAVNAVLRRKDICPVLHTHWFSLQASKGKGFP